MDLFAFIFHPPGYSVAAKARKLVHEKKILTLKNLALILRIMYNPIITWHVHFDTNFGLGQKK